MNTYERRDPLVLTCDQTYLTDIEQYEEYPCDISAGACVWYGYFKPVLFNAEMPVYTWTSTMGIITDDTLPEIEIMINSAFVEDFSVTCLVTCATTGSYTFSKNFSTMVCPAGGC